MDRRRRRHDRSDAPAARGALRHLQDLRGSGGSHPLDGDSRRAGHWRGCRHGNRAGRGAGRRHGSGRSLRNDLRNARAHAAHGRQSVLGDRSHEARLRGIARSPAAAAARAAHRRSPANPPRGHRHQSSHRPQRRAARSGRQDRAHALQCGRAGHRGIWHRAGRDSRCRLRRQEDRRIRR